MRPVATVVARSVLEYHDVELTLLATSTIHWHSLKTVAGAAETYLRLTDRRRLVGFGACATSPGSSLLSL